MIDPQPEPLRRESTSTTLTQDTCSLTSAALNLPPLAVESFGRLGEEGYEFIDELATHAAGGRDGGSMAQKGVFKEHLGGYTGGHLPPSPAVQAVTTRTSTRGGEKSQTSVEHINTNDLGSEC